MAGQVPASLIIETIVEHVAKRVNKHPIMVKELNLYEKHQVGGFRMGLELLASLIGYLLGFRMDWMLAQFPVLSCCKWLWSMLCHCSVSSVFRAKYDGVSCENDIKNNNVHLSCTRQRPERSHDTY